MEIVRHRKFDEWLRKLRDRNAQRRILYWVRRCESSGMVVGDVKSVGDGIYESRFHFGAGYRVYFTYREQRMVLLLIGGDKSTQRKDIEESKSIATAWKDVK